MATLALSHFLVSSACIHGLQCGDSSCVWASQWCDGVEHCPAGQDEANCGIFLVLLWISPFYPGYYGLRWRSHVWKQRFVINCRKFNSFVYVTDQWGLHLDLSEWVNVSACPQWGSMAPASCYRSMGPVGGGTCALGAGVRSRAGPAAWRWATAGQRLILDYSDHSNIDRWRPPYSSIEAPISSQGNSGWPLKVDSSSWSLASTLKLPSCSSLFWRKERIGLHWLSSALQPHETASNWNACFLFSDSNSCPDDSVVTLQCTGTFKHITFVATHRRKMHRVCFSVFMLMWLFFCPQIVAEVWTPAGPQQGRGLGRSACSWLGLTIVGEQ